MMTELKLKDKVAIVTGAGSGIGRDAGLRLASMGAAVAAVGRTFAKIAELEAEIKSAGGICLPVECNVSDPDSVRQMIAVVEKRLGAPDILINSAGIHSGADILGSDDSTVRGVMDSNLLGTIFCTREVFGLMKRSGRGHIINIASQGAGWPGRWEAIYGTAKAAQVMFSLKTLAQFEFENEKIRKNGGRDSFFCHVLCPGAVDTPLQSKNKDKSSMLRTSDISDMITTLLLNPAHGLDSLADKAKNANYQIGPIGVFEKHQNIIRMFK